MSDQTNKPVIFLAFANDRDDIVGYLRNLPDEARRLREVLELVEQAGLCEVVVRTNSTAADIFKVFQDPRYRNRIAIFHYGGHANGYQLLLESAAGQTATADAGGLAAFLGQQQGLQLVFLNSCSTQPQTQGLLDANISAVISTSQSIDDQVATDFSCRFYQGLAGGASVRTAYHEAEAAARTAKGGNPRALYFGDPDEAKNRLEADRWPWNLYLREGSESADQWNLPEAANDPLFGLPPLPEQDLPENPYRHLNWFTRKDAEVFFGRGHQIRELYDRLTAPRTAPIILFYGQSGVGKSSILDAGLIPRLEPNCEVRYLRRGEGGLLDTLQRAFLPEAADVPIETAWHVKEEQLRKPLIVFLDQVEELYTRPLADVADELDQLLKVVKATFCDPQRRPLGKLVLGFRKEWLAELEAQLVAYELARTKLFLEPLDRRGVIEVVQGPARSEQLRERYGLTVEDGLAELIADDLLEDRGSAIAPTLQILLTKMWAQATQADYEHPHFTQALYHDLKRAGILLRDFLNQQIAAFRQRYPEAVASGFLLDILAVHTTSLGTANQSTVEQLHEQYAHLSDQLPAVLQLCQDLYLLTIPTSTGKETAQVTRLVHDTLAPLVREQFDVSDLPGQRARRILDAKSADWEPAKPESDSLPAGMHQRRPDARNLLDDIDLKTVEEGIGGARQWNEAERRLVAASRQARASRRRRSKLVRYFLLAATVLIAVSAGFSTWQWRVAADGRKSYLEQKNWGNKRVDYYRAGLHSIRQHIRAIRPTTGETSTPPDREKVETALAAIETDLRERLRGMVLADGGRVSVPRVYFVTTRRMEANGDFGHGRSSAGPEYGYCDVSIPQNHAKGTLESPALGTVEDPSRHVVLQTLQRTTAETFREQLRPWIGGDKSHVLVFVHSWNTTFNDAARRAAQVAHDVQFEGEVVLFSWTSRASSFAYTHDLNELAFSYRDFPEMLDQLSLVFGDEGINLLGHGLGAELVTRGCVEWLTAKPGRRLGQVVLAGADIDTEVFTQSYAPRLSAAASRVTLYVVPDDTALAASRAVHSKLRVGATIVEISGVDTIEVSDPNLDLIGHSYYGSSSLMLRDLALLLRGGPASERGLQREGRHYTLR